MTEDRLDANSRSAHVVNLLSAAKCYACVQCAWSGRVLGYIKKLTSGILYRLSWSQELESLYERLQAPARAQEAAREALRAAQEATRREAALRFACPFGIVDL